MAIQIGGFVASSFSEKKTTLEVDQNLHAKMFFKSLNSPRERHLGSWVCSFISLKIKVFIKSIS